MKKTALLIRSNGSAERLRFLIKSADKQDIADVYIVLDCTNNGNMKRAEIRKAFPNSNIIELTKEFIEGNGLAYFTRSTWQCGDYFYYAAFVENREYSYYWLIDDDVVFNLDFSGFLNKSENIHTDLLGFEVGPRNENWSWYKSMNQIYPNSVFGMLYPLSRLSGRAISFLLQKRILYNSKLDLEIYKKSSELIPEHANDEAFTATTLKNNGFLTKSLYQEFKNEFTGFFSTERPVLYQELQHPHTSNKVIHPISDTARANEKFKIIYKKYGPEKMLRRAEEISNYCGEDIWNECFEKSVDQLNEELEGENKSSIQKYNANDETRVKNKMSKKEVKLFWWRGANQAANIGDEINGKVVEVLSGRRVVRSRLADADMLAIGSVLHFPQRENVLEMRKNPYLVWGSGTLNAVPIVSQEKFVLTAVRGPLTNSLFGHRSNIPFGDPGLLASRIWEQKGQKTAKWGLIPHYSQLERPWVKKLLENSENCRLIDVTNPDIDKVMQEIYSCEFIASTSLHGLIFADSYKIPSVWLWDGALHSGGSWKFFDYFSGSERNLSDNVSPSKIERLDSINMDDKSFNNFCKVDLICNKLINALPV